MRASARRIGVPSGEFWEARYKSGGNSGDGSYGVNGRFKIDVLNNYFHRVEPLGVLDFGVGDFTYSSVIAGKRFPFFGIDVSAMKVAQLKGQFGQYANIHFATSLDAFKDQLFDYVISLDVIFHLLEDLTYNGYINQITQTSVENIVVYSSNFKDDKWELHVRHRRFVPDILSRGYKLIEYIPNPTHTTYSDFYFFKRYSTSQASTV